MYLPFFSTYDILEKHVAYCIYITLTLLYFESDYLIIIFSVADNQFLVFGYIEAYYD